MDNVDKKDIAGMEDTAELAWEEISREHLIQDEWIDFRRSVYRYPDGRIYQPFYTYSRRDYAVIVATDEAGRALCVRQFRQGIRRVTTEFPAGGIEDWDADESPRDKTARALVAAKRELREETGYESDHWTHLMTVPSNATISDNLAYLFRAEDCRRVTSQHLDETEVLKVRLLAESEVEDLIREGNFPQAMHILAWMLAKQRKGD